MKLDSVFETSFIGANDTATHRVCGCCGELKPVSEFYKDGTYSNGTTRYRRDCRECYKKTRLAESMRKKVKK